MMGILSWFVYMLHDSSVGNTVPLFMFIKCAADHLYSTFWGRQPVGSWLSVIGYSLSDNLGKTFSISKSVDKH